MKQFLVSRLLTQLATKSSNVEMLVDYSSFSSVDSMLHAGGGATEKALSSESFVHTHARTHAHTHTHTHTHPFNGPLSRTTQASRYQKGKTNLDFTEARDSEWKWHQLGHMLCMSAHHSRQITTPAPHHSVFYRLDALPAAQPGMGSAGIICSIPKADNHASTAKSLSTWVWFLTMGDNMASNGNY